jgi:hypothetical protein
MKFFKHLKMPTPAANGGAPLSETSNDSRPYQSQRRSETQPPDCRSETYMQLDERKWAGTLFKVYRHMRAMERTKYLEPNFSTYFSPLVKYLATKYKLMSAVSNISGFMVSSQANWKKRAMDVVVEE